MATRVHRTASFAPLQSSFVNAPDIANYQMGFHTETRNFVQFFILDQSQKRMYELGLAADVLRDAVSCASCQCVI